MHKFLCRYLIADRHENLKIIQNSPTTDRGWYVKELLGAPFRSKAGVNRVPMEAAGFPYLSDHWQPFKSQKEERRHQEQQQQQGEATATGDRSNNHNNNNNDNNKVSRYLCSLRSIDRWIQRIRSALVVACTGMF